jgi:carbon monoxide dehydrogenase subunit G
VEIDHVDVDTVWSVITDYDHLAEIMPDLKQSYTVERISPDEALVFQEGVTRVLGFPVRVAVTLAMHEVVSGQERVIFFRLARRNVLMESMDGEARLEPTDRGTRVSLTLSMRARGPLRAFSAAVAQAEVPKRLRAVQRAVENIAGHKRSAFERILPR